MSSWFLYMIRTADGSLYTGISTAPERRLREHAAGGRAGARSLRGKGPLQLVFTAPCPDRGAAARLEYRIKQLPKSAKEAIVGGQVAIAALGTEPAAGG